MGPQHPSTHGVLRLLLELDGETVLACTPIIGYLHTGIEKNTEYRTWQQGVTFVTRADYLAPFFNELGYCLAVEQLLGIEAPPRAQVLRVLFCELNRIASHLVWLATSGLELGAVSVMLYGFREREQILDIFEAAHRSADEPRVRPDRRRRDGPARGRPRPDRRLPADDAAAGSTSTRRCSPSNPIWHAAQPGRGRCCRPRMPSRYGVTGPDAARRRRGARTCGSDEPYGGYETYDFDVVTSDGADCVRPVPGPDGGDAPVAADRRAVRSTVCASPGPVMVEDPKVALAGAARGRTRRHRQLAPLRHPHHGGVDGGPDPSLQDGDRGRRRARRARSTCRWSRRAASSAFYVVSDGGHRPARVKMRDPSFANLQAAPQMVRGRVGRRRDRGDREHRPGARRGRPLMAVLSEDGRRTAEAILARYPAGRERSAVLPLLYLLQSVEGRLTQEGLREVGELLGITTAEVEAVASFYTMLRLRPTGTHVVSVCTNLSCALRGANEVFEAAHEAAGVEHGEETSPDGAFTVHQEECLGACDAAPAVQIDFANHDRVTPGADRRARRGAPRGRDPDPVARPRAEGLPRCLPDPRRPSRSPRERRRPTTRIVTVNWDDPSVIGIDGYLAAGGYEGLRAAARDDPVRGDRPRQDLRAPRPRRRRVPDGRRSGRSSRRTRASPPTSSRTSTSPSPAPSTTARSSSASPTGSSRGWRSPRYAVQSHLAFVYCRGEFLWPGEILRCRDPRGVREGRVRRVGARVGVRARRRVAPRRRRLHLRRGDRAAVLARGLPRAAPAASAVPRRRGPVRLARPLINNVETLATVPYDRARRVAEWFAKIGTEKSPGTEDLQRLAARWSGPATTSCRSGPRCGRCCEEHAGGVLGGRRLKAWTPGGSSTPLLTDGAPRRRPGLRVDHGRRLAAGDGRDHRDGRDRLHRRGGAAAGAVLRARVVRQVHAVPRGHVVGHPGARPHRARATGGPRTSRCWTSWARTSCSRPSARSPTAP